MTATQDTIRFSGHTLDKATKAKVTLENYYSNLIAQHIERKQRYLIFISQKINHLSQFHNQFSGTYCVIFKFVLSKYVISFVWKLLLK